MAAWLRALLLLGCLASLGASEPRVDPGKAAQVKAAYLLNFLRYTQWPESSFAGPEDPFRVAVLGDEVVARALESLARGGGPVEGRGVTVTPGRLRLNASQVQFLRQCHLVFVGGEQAHARLPDLNASLGGAPVLIVGDGKEFAAAGGMLGLILDQGRIVFDANPSAMRRNRVQVSAKVLKLAHIVGEETPP